MKKEKLLETKENRAEKNLMGSGLVLDSESLKMFSLKQIDAVCRLMLDTVAKKEEWSPFVILSATEVLQKSSGRIANFVEGGHMEEESEQDILLSASVGIYKKWKNQQTEEL